MCNVVAGDCVVRTFVGAEDVAEVATVVSEVRTWEEADGVVSVVKTWEEFDNTVSIVDISVEIDNEAPGGVL